MMLRIRICIVTFLLAAVAGCTNPDAPLEPAVLDNQSPNASVAQGGALHSVLHAFALAMRREDVRAQVRNALRASPWTEHKLVLQDFVATPAGKHLVRAAADATHSKPDHIEALIAELPPMDFYVPFREHRRSWKGTRDIAVAGTLEDNSVSLSGYDSDGVPATFELRNGTPSTALLVLHPAERKGRRIRPQANRPGMVIQDADDGEISASLVWTDSDGTDREMDLSPLYMPPDTCGTECAPSSPAPTDTTRLRKLWVNYTDWSHGGLELEFRSEYVSPTGVLAQHTLRLEGVIGDYWYILAEPLLFYRIPEGSADFIRVQVTETDAFSHDDKGTGIFYLSDRLQTRSITKSHIIGAPSVTNVQLDWTPKY